MRQQEIDIICGDVQTRLPEEEKTVRLFHGPGGRFPGLEDVAIDLHPNLAVITLYRDRDEYWIQQLLNSLLALNKERFFCVLLQRRDGPRTTNRVLQGELPERAWAVEDGFRYRLRLQDAAQNLGFFGDMRLERQQVRQMATGKKVLNLFAYTCSFSVAAVAGGAKQVVNLDMNRGALTVGRENHRDNDLDPRSVSFLAHDLFSSWGKLKKLGPFDLIILDPPAAQGKSFTAERHWPKLLRRSAELLAPGGEMLAALNAPHLDRPWLRDIIAEETPQLEVFCEPEPPEEFAAADPDRGLKLYWMKNKD